MTKNAGSIQLGCVHTLTTRLGTRTVQIYLSSQIFRLFESRLDTERVVLGHSILSILHQIPRLAVSLYII